MSCSKSYFYAKLRLSDMPSTTRGLPSSSNTVHVCIEHSEKRSGGEARPREPCQIRAFKSKKERTAPGYTCASNTRRSTASLQNRKVRKQKLVTENSQDGPGALCGGDLKDWSKLTGSEPGMYIQRRQRGYKVHAGVLALDGGSGDALKYRRVRGRSSKESPGPETRGSNRYNTFFSALNHVAVSSPS